LFDKFSPIIHNAHIANIFEEFGMAQLHFYVPDAVAEKIKAKAEKSHLPVSKYLAQLAKREVEAQWPDGYFELFGAWHGEELKRPEQLVIEKRETLN